MAISKSAADALDKLMARREARLAPKRVDLHNKPKPRAEVDMEAPEAMNVGGGMAWPKWASNIVTAQPVGRSIGNGGYRR